jgi:hypothetical protein
MTGDHATGDYDTYQTGFEMWWRHVETVDCNNLENDQILRLAIGRGLSSETDEGELGAHATVKEIDELCFFDPEYQTPCEPWEKGQSHIISVAEIEGGFSQGCSQGRQG